MTAACFCHGSALCRCRRDGGSYAINTGAQELGRGARGWEGVSGICGGGGVEGARDKVGGGGGGELLLLMVNQMNQKLHSYR